MVVFPVAFPKSCCAAVGIALNIIMANIENTAITKRLLSFKSKPGGGNACLLSSYVY